jgi:hypothetical protein
VQQHPLRVVVWYRHLGGQRRQLCVLGLKTSVLPTSIYMAQPNVPVSKTGHILPARLVRCGFFGAAGSRAGMGTLQAGAGAA